MTEKIYTGARLDIKPRHARYLEMKCGFCGKLKAEEGAI